MIKKKTDGLQNVFTNRGIQFRDNKTANEFTRRLPMNEFTADSIFTSEGIGRKIITLPVYEMLRSGFETNDKNEKFEQRLKRLKIVSILYEFLVWDRLYGGAVLVAGIADGGDLEDPLKGGKTPEDLKFLRVYSRYKAVIAPERIREIEDDNFAEPEYFDIITELNEYVRVHRSRCYVLKGTLTPPNMKLGDFNYWGDSALTPILDYIERYVHSLDASDDILEDFIQTILQIDNLQALVVNGQDNLIKKRLELIDLGRSSKNTILLDSKEQYLKNASTVTGISDIIAKFEIGLSAVADIPATLLFGRSPEGMNATGESDLRNWYDRITFEQDNTLEPIIEWLQKITGQAIGIKMNPTREETPEEMTTNRLRQAQMDNIYTQMGVTTAQEIRDSRFNEAGEFSYSTIIDPSISADLMRDIEVDENTFFNPEKEELEDEE